MKRISCIFAIVLLGAVTSARAQSTWNYIISDAGDGNSLVTWSVTGDLATPPGPVIMQSGSTPTCGVSVVAPGIYTGSFQSDGTGQSLSPPDGSDFEIGIGDDIYAPIVAYATDTELGGGNDSFGLIAAPFPPRAIGLPLLYQPGTQSVTIPVPFSDFNPGTYQSQQSGLSTALTVNLTVESVPEPSTSALVIGAGIAVILTRRFHMRRPEAECILARVWKLLTTH